MPIGLVVTAPLKNATSDSVSALGISAHWPFVCPWQQRFVLFPNSPGAELVKVLFSVAISTRSSFHLQYCLFPAIVIERY